MRGGFRGGFGGGHGGSGRDFSQDIYADYPGPDHGTPTGPGLRMEQGFNGGGFPAAGGAGFGGAAYVEPEPSQQIMVRNVSGS